MAARVIPRDLTSSKLLLHPLLDRGAQSLVRWGTQIELRQRRAQIQARAADDDWATPSRERRVDLGVRERHVLPDRERTGNRHEPEQAVLQPRLLRGRRGAGQRAQPVVDLQRIGRDGDRVLAASAQQLRELDRDGRLPDRGRAENR